MKFYLLLSNLLLSNNKLSFLDILVEKCQHGFNTIKNCPDAFRPVIYKIQKALDTEISIIVAFS